MASQTSALISALGLGRPAVLGWSMGGVIAQALAVSHPAQVSRLILAATEVGTGKAVPLPPSAAMFALSPAEIAAQMFPNNQAGRQAGEIRVPTLVADGTLDQDIRPPNAGLLANSVPGAKLLLFDDAGHAFLFQDAAGFIPAVDTCTC